MEMETRDLTIDKNLAAFTGHRDLRPEDEATIAEKLETLLKASAIETILVGNAAGADSIAKTVAGKLDIAIRDLDAEVPRRKELTVPATKISAAEAEKLNQAYYSLQADYIVKNTDCVIAVWDGVFTVRPGGTSDIVQKVLNGQKEFSIHHLVCPRQKNPYPVVSLVNDVINSNNGTFNRIPFTVPFSWVTHTVCPKRKRKKKYAVGDYQFRTSFLIPGIFAVFTLALGFIGFSIAYPGHECVNNFFRAVNLITFNSSVIEGKSVDWRLHLARIFGFLAATSAIVFAIWAATAKRRNLLRLLIWGKLKTFDLVLGINQKSYDLIVDLHQQHKKRIVVLHPQGENKYLLEVKKFKRVIAIEGNLFSGTTLKSVHPHKANHIYIMGESDTENIRATHEIDLIVSKHPPTADARKKPAENKTFVHIEEENKKLLLINSLSDSFRAETSVFNTYENMVRRLQLYFPIDRFYQNPDAKEAHAIILGFENLGKALAVYSLKQGHYSRNKKLNLKIFCVDALAEKEKFLLAYPQFDSTVFGNTDYDSNVMAYTWSNISLGFFELPASDKDWLSDNNAIFSAIEGSNIVNVYTCFPDGIASSAYLGTILPKIEIKKLASNANVQVFCYYNYPDKKEEAIIEKYLNGLAPHTFIKCFGNFLDECSASFIQDMSLDALPKLINASYSGKPEASPETLWEEISEKDKISNRQAADHLWCKLRLIWPKIDWRFDPKTFELSTEVAEQIFQDPILDEYGEIEHRRWCADLLLQGFVPFDFGYGSDEYVEIVEKWKDKVFKKEQQIQKKHISLVPYKHLLTIDTEKDRKQIKAIPDFLRTIIKP